MDILTACEQLFLRENLRFEPRLIFKKYERLAGSAKMKRRSAARLKNANIQNCEHNKRSAVPDNAQVCGGTGKKALEVSGEQSAKPAKLVLRSP